MKHTSLINKPNHPVESINAYEYWAKVKKIVDGDTLDLEISLGFDTVITKRVRLIGVDTPEVWGVKHSSEEYKEGKKASDYVKKMLPNGKWVEIKVYQGQERGKFGRWLCEVYVDGLNLNEDLVNKGYAKEFMKLKK